MVLRTLLFISLLTFPISSFSQEASPLIQITGFIVESGTELPLSYSHVINVNRKIGKASNVNGYFSIVAYVGDTLKFTSVGYVNHFHAVQKDDRHLDVTMQIDIRELPATEIRPWPKDMLALRQDLKNKQIINATTELQHNMMRAGFNPPPAHVEPPPPNIMNPISFFYEKFIKKIQEKRPKKKMIDQMPPLD